MIGQIGESKINEVRERTDIIELVSQYVTLKRSGANHMGLCPFHSEKSPSFSVHAGRQFYHCFGCGVGGDAFSFLMKMEGLAFPDAVKRLAERAGIEVEERTLSPEEEQRQQQRERLYRVNELAADYFHQLLMEQPQGEPGRQYLKVRGYGRKAAGEYQLGYTTDTWAGLTQHLQQQGAVAEDARTLGLIRPGKQERGDYDLFRGRLIFPIYDLSGRVVAFGGRVLDDSKPKYINSPESPIYHKGGVLFGLYQARQAMRQSGEVILVEGYFDQLALYRAGFPQVVATCGTALTAEHARLLKRYVQRVLLLFDQDSAGKQATFKAMTALQDEGVPAAVIDLPTGEDPDSFVQSQGGEAFRQRLEKARPAMDLFMEDVLGQAGPAIEQKVRAAEIVVERIAGLVSNLEQDLYLKDLAARSSIDLVLLKQKLAEAGQRLTQQKHAQRPEPPPREFRAPVGVDSPGTKPQRKQVSAPEPAWDKAEGILLCLLLHNTDVREKLSTTDLNDYLVSAPAVRIAEYFLAKPGNEDIARNGFLQEFSSADQALIRPLLMKDPSQFSEDAELMADDCLRTLKKTGLKKRAETLQLRLIPEAEKSGDEALADQYRREWHQLQSEIKAFRQINGKRRV